MYVVNSKKIRVFIFFAWYRKMHVLCRSLSEKFLITGLASFKPF